MNILRKFTLPVAVALLSLSGALAQDAPTLESELKALQQKQQQELLDMQKKIATQQTAKLGDPRFLQNKIAELEGKLKSYEAPRKWSNTHAPRCSATLTMSGPSPAAFWSSSCRRALCS